MIDAMTKYLIRRQHAITVRSERMDFQEVAA
jgi:hypothetical protein